MMASNFTHSVGIEPPQDFVHEREEYFCEGSSSSDAGPSGSSSNQSTASNAAQNQMQLSGKYDDAVKLVITEQPMQRGFRFRYCTEGGAHGCLQGANSSKEMKTFPTVKVINYDGPVSIEVFLVTNEKYPRRHVHRLFGKNCDANTGTCTGIASRETSMTFPFQNIGILHTPKKEVEKRLIFLMKLDEKNKNKSDEVIVKEAKEGAKNMELNCVKLCFRATLIGFDKRILDPVYSVPFYNSKAPSAGLLKICRMSKATSVASGGDEIFLLCEKVQRDVCVRFYETNEDDEIVWQAEGKFSQQDVHKQFAIVFRTPPYRDIGIVTETQVQVQLTKKSELRMRDPVHSAESLPFTYLPEFSKSPLFVKPNLRLPPYAGPDRSRSNNDSAYPGGGAPSASSGAGSSRNTFYGTMSSGSSSRSTSHCSLSPQERNFEISYSCPNDGRHTEKAGAAVVLVKQFLDTSTVGQLRARDPKAVLNPADVLETKWNKDMIEEFFDESLNRQMKELTTRDDSTGNAVDTVQARDSQPIIHVQTLSQEHTSDHYITREALVSSFHRFAKSGDLLYAFNNYSSLLKIPDENGNTILHNAILNEQRHIITNLLSYTELEIVNIANNNLETPLHVAAERGDVDVVRHLLSAGGDASLADHAGRTALHLAAGRGHARVLETVLRLHRSSPFINEYNDQGLTSIHIAAGLEDSCCLHVLIEYGADVNARSLKFGETPLHIAVGRCLVENVKLLLRQKTVDTDVEMTNGMTALDLARVSANENIVGLLEKEDAHTENESV